jgi:hypothetical protein
MKSFISGAALAAALTLLASAAQAETAVAGPLQVEIKSTPIESFEARQPDRKRFGKLEYRGGLTLTSPNRHFGGVSGLVVEPDGRRFTAITDRGFWITGEIVAGGDKPAGIVKAEMAPVIAPDGQAAGEGRRYDTESLTRDGSTYYVGVERVNEILKFDFGKNGMLARAVPVPVPPGVKKLPYNGGLEALVFVPKGMPLSGTLLAFGEQGPKKEDDNPAFLIGGPQPGAFFVKRGDDFDVTDATLTPDGKLILLERHFSLARGPAMRIRRIDLAAIKPGAVVDGEILLTADFGYEIDNMEAISAHRNAGGETILTVMSDDNFNPLLQRTILLRFAIVE